LSDIHANLLAALADRYVRGRELGRGGRCFAGDRMYYSAEERQSDVGVMELERP
jgi:hypothetical protein